MIEDVVTGPKTQVGSPAELAAAREARGMSQLDISQRIKLQVRQVGALEGGQWDALPGRSFVRGALRSYGKLLDVDVAPLLETIGGFAEPSEVSVMQPIDTSSPRSSGAGFNGGGRGRPMIWVVAGLIGVVAVVLYFGSAEDTSRIRSWLHDIGKPGDRGADTAPEASPPAVTELPTSLIDPGSAASAAPADGARRDRLPSPGATGTPAGTPGVASPSSSPEVSGAAPAAAPPDASFSAAPSAAPSGPLSASSAVQSGPSSAPLSPARGGPSGEAAVPVQAAAAPVGAARTAPSATTAAPAAPAAAPASAAADLDGVVHLKANKDAWVEVRNADGSLLHNRLVKSGSSIELKGTPPYRLVLGNASSVELSYEGTPLELKPHIQGNNIARLQLQ